VNSQHSVPRTRAEREHASRRGLAALVALAEDTAMAPPRALSYRGASHAVLAGTGVSERRGGRGDSGAHYYSPVRLAPGEAAPGALSDAYDVPEVRFVRSRWLLGFWVSISLLGVSVLLARRALPGASSGIVMSIWIVGLVTRVIPLVISWLDKPFTTTARQDRFLKQLRVVVAVPVYNEDPALLDRCLWALANQSRQPNVVHVVEDGPSSDYAILREHWTRQRQGRVRFQWTCLPENGGKKAAQSIVFCSHPDADIFITVDSDTTLEFRAVEEGLKPFADPRNASVAGVEENFNKRVNWLTRTVAVRNTYYQLTVWGAQSVLGDLLVNRGTFALYRAWIIREIVPAYVGETFIGRPIKLGDDAALTLFSSAHGRTVQQLSAFSLPMHPEKLSHHFRQWTRWARGAAIRNCWRVHYLPVWSYGFWWTVLFWYLLFMSAGVPLLIAATWPRSEHVVEFAAAMIICWTYMVSARILSVRRSDDTFLFRVTSLLLYPSGILWATVVLRWVRLYGVTTCLKQRWTTRQSGTESMLLPEPEFDSGAPVFEGALL
jgi:hyaluronan synthase